MADGEATIGRFIQRNRERIEEVFKACVRKAYAGGLIGLVVYAVDGTKVAAQVSKRKSLHRGGLEEILRRLEEVVAESGEDIGEEVSYRLPEAMQGEGKLEAFIRGERRREGMEEEIVRGGGAPRGGEVFREPRGATGGAGLSG